MDGTTKIERSRHSRVLSATRRGTAQRPTGPGSIQEPHVPFDTRNGLDSGVLAETFTRSMSTLT